MTNFVADDFPAIAAELKKLEAEKGGPPGCIHCQGRGWMIHGGPHGTFWATCGTCWNPLNKPQPQGNP